MSAISNARWLTLAQGYRILLQLVSMSVLARILPPSDYGLMAMAWTATNLASLFRDLGTASALIQKQELNERIKSTVFWMNMVLGSSLGAVLIASAGVIATAFNQPALTPILSWLAISFPLGSLCVVHQAMLERNSRFGVLTRIEVVASTIGLAVAIFAALRGAGVYSFVLQTITITLLYIIQLWLAARWRPSLVWDMGELSRVFGFSANLSIFNVINFLARNADSMIIGRFLGPGALGTYSMAYKLMLFPVQNLTFVASRALFPVMSRSQDAPDQMAMLYSRAVATVAAISMPLMAGLYVLREPCVRVFFGSQWGDVAHLIAWLAPVGAIQSIASATGVVYMAKGRTDLLMKLGILGAVLAIGAFIVGVSGGVSGVARCYLIANIVSFIPYTLIASRVVGLPYGAFVKAIVPSAVCVLAMMPVAWLCLQAAPPTWHDLAVCVLTASVAALTYAACYFILFRDQAIQLASALLGSRLARGIFAKKEELTRAQAVPDADPSKPVWLFVNLSREFGGHEVMLLRWIAELSKASRVTPVLVCPSDTRLAMQASGQCLVIQTADVGGPGHRIGRLGSFLRSLALLRRTTKALRPELAVVAEGCILAQGHGLYAARLLRLRTVLYVPIVATFESMGFARAAALEKRVRRFYGKLPHAWVTITIDQASELRRWSQITQPIFTLPNTVASSIEEQSSRAAEEIGVCRRRDRRMRVLVMGRLDPHQKGLDFLLDHLKGAPGLAEHFTVHFAGEGPYAEVLMSATRDDTSLSRFVTLEPWANAIEVFAKHDVVLLPSRFEGVPLVMLEAMALRIPIVASDLEGTRAYLPEECLFPVGRIDKAFERLAALRDSRLLWAGVATRNLETFRQRASGAAFAAAVDILTSQLAHLARTKSRRPCSVPTPIQRRNVQP